MSIDRHAAMITGAIVAPVYGFAVGLAMFLTGNAEALQVGISVAIAYASGWFGRHRLKP